LRRVTVAAFRGAGIPLRNAGMSGFLGAVVFGLNKLVKRLFGFGDAPKSLLQRPLVEQRRGRRVPAAMRILLYGRVKDEPFQEHTQTIDVSSHGGLFPISAAVEHSQKLILTNLDTDDDLACRVTRLVRTKEGQTLAGVEFLQPSLQFWGPVVASFGHENSTAERIS